MVVPQRRWRSAESACFVMDGSPLSVLLGAMDAFSKCWSVQIVPAGCRPTLAANGAPQRSGVFPLELDPFGRSSLRDWRSRASPQSTPPSKFVVAPWYRGGYGRPKGRRSDAAYLHYFGESLADERLAGAHAKMPRRPTIALVSMAQSR